MSRFSPKPGECDSAHHQIGGYGKFFVERFFRTRVVPRQFAFSPPVGDKISSESRPRRFVILGWYMELKRQLLMHTDRVDSCANSNHGLKSNTPQNADKHTKTTS